MVVSCCICHKTAQPGISMHRIPKVNNRLNREFVELLKSRREGWIRVLECIQILDFENLSQYFICSKHFVSGQPADFRNKEHIDWLPNIDGGEEKEEISIKIASQSINNTSFNQLHTELFGEENSILQEDNVLDEPEPDITILQVEYRKMIERIESLKAQVVIQNERISNLEKEVECLS